MDAAGAIPACSSTGVDDAADGELDLRPLLPIPLEKDDDFLGLARTDEAAVADTEDEDCFIGEG